MTLMLIILFIATNLVSIALVVRQVRRDPDMPTFADEMNRVVPEPAFVNPKHFARMGRHRTSRGQRRLWP